MALPNHNAVDFERMEVRCDQVTAATSITVAGNTLLGTEFAALDGVTAGTVTASIVVIVDANKDIASFRNVTLTGNLVSGTTTLSEADLALVDGITAGTGLASKAVTLSAANAFTSPTAANTKFTWSVTSDSTDAGVSVEPFVHNTTMTGVGGVGGRARFELDTNVALGGWANALKAQTEFGATGAVTGLGSAFVAELTLSAGTAAGTYAPVEIELNLATGALTGTETSLVYGSVNGADAGTFDTNGHILSLNGLTAGANNVFRTGLTAATVNAATTAALRVVIGGVAYYIPLATATA
jgi:hypothetical protein